MKILHDRTDVSPRLIWGSRDDAWADMEKAMY